MAQQLCRDGQHAIKRRLALFWSADGGDAVTYLRSVAVHNLVLSSEQVRKEHAMLQQLLIDDGIGEAPKGGHSPEVARLVREARRQVAHLDRCEQLYQSHGAHLEKMREARRKKEALLLEEQGCSFSPTLSKLAQKLNIPLGVDGYDRGASCVSVVASHSSPSNFC